MKQVSETFRSRLRSGNLKVARLWTLTLLSGRIDYLTDHDKDIVYENIKYKSIPGITVSAIRDSIDAGFSDASIEIAITEDGLTEEVARYNGLSGASFSLERVFWDDPTLGTIFDFAGSIKTTELTDRRRLSLSVNGLGSLTGAVGIGENYSERCRNIFGDFRCKVDIEALGVPFFVVAGDASGIRFYMSTAPRDDEDDNNEEKSIVTRYDNNENSDNANIQDKPFEYTVPNRQFLEVTVVGGGGGQSVNHEVLDNFVGFRDKGFDGGNSAFRSAVAFGGEGAPIDKHGVDKGGQGGDNILVGKGGIGGKLPYGVIVPVDPPPGSLPYSNKIMFQGGNGGLVTKRFTIGPEGATGVDLHVGDVVAGYVGAAGYSYGINSNDIRAKGQPGYVIITARGNKFTVDEGFRMGTIRWITGNNANRIMPVKAINGQVVIVDYNLGYPIVAGDTGIFRPGCNHYRSDCKKYNNIPNYRGEPDVPLIGLKPTPLPSDYPPKSVVQLPGMALRGA